MNIRGRHFKVKVRFLVRYLLRILKCFNVIAEDIPRELFGNPGSVYYKTFKRIASWLEPRSGLVSHWVYKTFFTTFVITSQIKPSDNMEEIDNMLKCDVSLFTLFHVKDDLNFHFSPKTNFFGQIYRGGVFYMEALMFRSCQSGVFTNAFSSIFQ